MDIFVHGHVNVCGYVEYNCKYCVIVGDLILTVCVILINELYNRRIANDKVKRKRNIRVDIRSFWSWYSSVDGGTDGNKLKLLI
jgi:hypothetical protein